MGKLIAVVGNSGAGKTTLVRALARAGGYFVGLEEHAGRPYQARLASGLTAYAVANQVDYLLLRAEQEQAIRQQPRPGLQDGGLEMDFFVFTRLFYSRGYLDEDGYALCRRLYAMLRGLLPPPDLLIYLDAPQAACLQRMQRRSRGYDVTRPEDLQAGQSLLDAWLEQTTIPVVRVDAAADDPDYSACLPDLQIRIDETE
jgi:deoxyadenosine/deoxycytidine kinase